MLGSTKRYEKRKSPGNDGLTKEFYVWFFNEISDSLVVALNRSFEVSQLSSSQRKAVIVLIEKKEKDKRLIKNWRPISLINVDSKIASNALASRMKTVLSKIIKCDQTAYVKGRYIGESILIYLNILQSMKRSEFYFLLILRKHLTQSNIHLYLPLLNHLDSVHSLFNG